MNIDTEYREYFDEVARIERQMIRYAYDIIVSLDDKSIKNAMKNIADAEIRHYASIKGVLDSIVFKTDIERRRYVRIYALGDVIITRQGTPTGIEAWCVDVSQGGTAIESHGKLAQGETIDLKIDMYNSKKPIFCSGVVRWIREVEPGFFIGGIEFKEPQKNI